MESDNVTLFQDYAKKYIWKLASKTTFLYTRKIQGTCYLELGMRYVREQICV